jgi:hypothetical protein
LNPGAGPCRIAPDITRRLPRFGAFFASLNRQGYEFAS